MTPSAATVPFRSLSEKLREGAFAADDDSPAFFAASASVCAPARDANAAISTSSTNHEPGRRGLILFMNIGGSRPAPKVQRCTPRHAMTPRRHRLTAAAAAPAKDF